MLAPRGIGAEVINRDLGRDSFKRRYIQIHRGVVRGPRSHLQGGELQRPRPGAGGREEEGEGRRRGKQRDIIYLLKMIGNLFNTEK